MKIFFTHTIFVFVFLISFANSSVPEEENTCRALVTYAQTGESSEHFYLSPELLEFLEKLRQRERNLFILNQELRQSQRIHDVYLLIENAQPSFYRLSVNGQPQPFYVLGTVHHHPFALLPHRVKNIIAGLFQNPKTVCFSELGNGSEEFEDVDESSAESLERLKKLIAQYPQIALNIDQEVATEEELYRGLYGHIPSLVEEKALADHLREFREHFERGIFFHPDIAPFRNIFEKIWGDETDNIINLLHTLSPRVFFFMGSKVDLIEEMSIPNFGMDYFLNQFFQGHQHKALDRDSLRRDGNNEKMVEAILAPGTTPCSLQLQWLIPQLRKIQELIEAAEGEDDIESVDEEDVDITPFTLKNIDWNSIYLHPYFFDREKSEATHGNMVDVYLRNEGWAPVMLEGIKQAQIAGHPLFFYWGVGHLRGEKGMVPLLAPYGIAFHPIQRDGTFAP